LEVECSQVGRGPRSRVAGNGQAGLERITELDKQLGAHQGSDYGGQLREHGCDPGDVNERVVVRNCPGLCGSQSHIRCGDEVEQVGALALPEALVPLLARHQQGGLALGVGGETLQYDCPFRRYLAISQQLFVLFDPPGMPSKLDFGYT
jgi:hypothetical protein